MRRRPSNVSTDRTNPTEALVRQALRRHVTNAGAPTQTVDEFWVPQSNERADMAHIGRVLAGFEIKTQRDSLRRLPRQAAAYERVFDRCTAVVAPKHRDAAIETLPSWWGITEIAANGSISFHQVRDCRPNRSVDPETLVRLLWRDEAERALVALGVDPAPRTPRAALWRELVRVADLRQLRAAVRVSLLARTRGDARAGRRFTRSAEVAEADR